MSDEPKVRILIVDDEAPQMRALCDTLGSQGYETTGFNAGRDALDALEPGRFDLLLTDLMMPEINGITLLRLAIDKDPNLVGIIMTGEGTIATAVEAMQAGAFDYILKPFRLSAVLPVLHRALAVRRLRIENTELAKRVRERTAELEAANQELEAFSYSVSHDLRAPLRHVDGFSRLLQQKYGGQLPTEAKRLLDQVSASAGRMGQLIDDLLRFSRLSRQALTKGRVSISGLVAQILDEQTRDRPKEDLDIRVGELPDCEGDSGLLAQVFVNLISNALKFSRGRKPAVIEIGSKRVINDMVYFVKDNGAGFDDRYAAKLFGVFQRLHRADQFEGTGVGLSIVQRILHRHGGRIWAESKLDAGATFYFTLPQIAPKP